MKKLLFISGIIMSNFSIAQNIGVGTASPASKLTVSGSETTDNGLNTAIQITNTAPGGGSWYLRTGATGTETPAGGFSISNGSLSRFSMDNTGRLGLGLQNPTEKLHLNTGNIRLAGSDKGIILNSADRAMITRGFDPFTSGVHSGLGRWGLFMEPNNLTLGIPNTFGKEVEVAKFNEDGTKIPVFSVSGEGLIKVFDDAGTTGQVLTSGGAANTASWQNAAFTNTTRFSAKYTSLTNGDVLFTTTPLYNLDVPNISIAADGITLQKAGLYHFDLFLEAGVDHASAPANIPILIGSVYLGTVMYRIIHSRMQKSSNDPNFLETFFYYTEKTSLDVYVTAGTKIKISVFQLSNTANNRNIAGYLNAYLIAP